MRGHSVLEPGRHSGYHSEGSCLFIGLDLFYLVLCYLYFLNCSNSTSICSSSISFHLVPFHLYLYHLYPFISNVSSKLNCRASNVVSNVSSFSSIVWQGNELNDQYKSFYLLIFVINS
jgi:hypothetical protein